MKQENNNIIRTPFDRHNFKFQIIDDLKQIDMEIKQEINKSKFYLHSLMANIDGYNIEFKPNNGSYDAVQWYDSQISLDDDIYYALECEIEQFNNYWNEGKEFTIDIQFNLNLKPELKLSDSWGMCLSLYINTNKEYFIECWYDASPVKCGGNIADIYALNPTGVKYSLEILKQMLAEFGEYVINKNTNDNK